MNSVDDEDNFPFITAEAHPSAHVNLADNDEDNFPFITAAADVKAIKVIQPNIPGHSKIKAM